jgi:transposase
MDNNIRKGKTDKKDAVRIAYFALEKSYQLKPYSPADQKYEDLKFFSRQYSQSVSLKVKTRVQLANLLDEIMPGIQNIITISSRYLENTLFFDFVEKYQSYERFAQMGEKRFINSYITFAQKHRCRGSQKKALAIYQAASNSIITRSPDVTTSLALSQCLLMLKQASSSADLLLRQMQSIAYTMPEYSVVRSMYGVGDRLAPILIAEIGDVRRFTSAKALNAYAGNDAPPYQSGQFEGTNRHISKRGSAYLRKACYEVMHSLKVHKPESDPVYQFITKKESEGKHKTVAKMAGVNKFLRIYYARVMELYK